MVGNEDFLQILKKKYLKKKLSSMQRVKWFQVKPFTALPWLYYQRMASNSTSAE